MCNDQEQLDRIRLALLEVRDTPFDSIRGVRDRYDSLTSTFECAPDASFTAVRLGAVGGEWIETESLDAGNVVLHLHGGGYLTGSLRSHRVLASNLARATRARVLLLDYRLAPEHPFPAAHLDAVEAYSRLLETGVDPNRLTVIGDSAGGGLAMSTLVEARERSLPQPNCCVAIGPMCDLEILGDSYAANAPSDPWMTIDSHQAVVRAFLQGASPRDPSANPLYADLAGLPPTLIQVSLDEMLLSDSVALAKRLESADVDVELDRWRGVLHDWHLFAPVLAAGRSAIEQIGEYVAARREALTESRALTAPGPLRPH